MALGVSDSLLRPFPREIRLVGNSDSMASGERWDDLSVDGEALLLDWRRLPGLFVKEVFFSAGARVIKSAHVYQFLHY